MTERQAKFLDFYLHGPRGVAYNATRAVEAAGYAWPGKQGPRLSTHPEVAAACDAHVERVRREQGECTRSLIGLTRPASRPASGPRRR